MAAEIFVFIIWSCFVMLYTYRLRFNPFTFSILRTVLLVIILTLNKYLYIVKLIDINIYIIVTIITTLELFLAIKVSKWITNFNK